MLYEVITLQTTAKNEVQTPDGVERIAQKRVYVPRVDIYEEEKEVVILADMPGVKAEDVEINLEKDVITSYSIHYTKLYDAGPHHVPLKIFQDSANPAYFWKFVDNLQRHRRVHVVNEWYFKE